MVTASEILHSQDEFYRKMLDNFSSDLRVSMPGIVTAFDSSTQTVTVQPSLRERITNTDGTQQWLQLPLLLDVPICLPRGGGMVITMPISAGDEGLIIFGDRCIDSWFSNGGVQNQIEKRFHDLSDSFFIPGIWNQTRLISNYSTSSMQIRTENGNHMIDISSSGIDLRGTIRKNGVLL